MIIPAPKSHSEARAQNGSLVPQKAKSVKRTHEETDRENDEHGMDRMAENSSAASRPAVGP